MLFSPLHHSFLLGFAVATFAYKWGKSNEGNGQIFIN